MEPQLATSHGGSAGGPDPGPGSAFAVLFAPIKTFHGLVTKPRFVIPLLLLLVLGTLTGAVLLSKIDPDDYRSQVRAQMEKQGLAGKELEDQVERMSGFMDKFGPIFAVVGAAFMAVVFVVVAALLFGGLKLAGAADLTFVQSLSLTMHSYMPSAVAMILMIPIGLSRESISAAAANSGNILSSNLGFLASEETSAALRALLSSIDLFSLWALVLMILGGAVMGRVSRGASAAVAIAIWVLGVAIRVGLASLQG